MIDLERFNKIKQQMLSTISSRGPSLPVHLAKATNVDPLFASAFLSELLSDKKVKTTNMKVGSSYLYYLPGQENLLEQFSQYLNQREREAFELLKEKKILEDSTQTPVIRVALRAIKDFAIPVQINNERMDQRIIWKYFLLNEEDFNSLITKSKPQENKIIEKIVEEIKETPEKQNIPEEKNIIEEKQENTQKEETNHNNSKEEIKENHSDEEEFSKKVERYLSEKKINLINISSKKKKEIIGTIRIETQLGEQRMHLVARDKKRITEKDIQFLTEKTISERMPVYFLTNGTLDKKSEVLLSALRDILKIGNLPEH